MSFSRLLCVEGMQFCMAASFYNVLISLGILALFMKKRKVRLTIITGVCEKRNSEMPHPLSQCRHPVCSEATSLHVGQTAPLFHIYC